MTKEDAIKVLEQIKEGFIAIHNGNPVMYGFSDYGVQAFDMAIEALKVGLIRCGECEYRDCCSELGDKVDVDDYCSFGERRIDEIN